MARRLSTLESPEETVKHAHTWARASENQMAQKGLDDYSLFFDGHLSWF